jgi:hypothetical protein
MIRKEVIWPKLKFPRECKMERRVRETSEFKAQNNLEEVLKEEEPEEH